MIPLGGAAFGHAVIEAGNAIKQASCRNALVVSEITLSAVGSKRAINLFSSFQDADHELPLWIHHACDLCDGGPQTCGSTALPWSSLLRWPCLPGNACAIR